MDTVFTIVAAFTMILISMPFACITAFSQCWLSSRANRKCGLIIPCGYLVIGILFYLAFSLTGYLKYGEFVTINNESIFFAIESHIAILTAINLLIFALCRACLKTSETKHTKAGHPASEPPYREDRAAGRKQGRHVRVSGEGNGHRQQDRL